VVAITITQIFVSGINFWYLLGAGLVGLISGIPLILFSPYRKERLLTFLHASQDPLGNSYHMRQILLGLGSGGIFGVGLGASLQKYSFLPEASTDSIFAVIAEELGLIGGLLVITLFIYFTIRVLKIAQNAPDIFSKTLAVGIASWIAGQAFLNIASMVGLVPLTGIPLPFISYGGSSLVMILVACGILLNISKYAEKTRK
jgi:cell division protein FtsW